MAKVKGPLMSMDARGQISKTLVFLGWKGLKTVRSYVVPANPQTAGQTEQRGHMATMVAAWHTVQFNPLDLASWRLLAAQAVSAMSGFNVFCKQGIEYLILEYEQSVAKLMTIVTNTGGSIAISYEAAFTLNHRIRYGYSPTVMGATVECAHVGEGDPYTATLPGLVVGEYIYFQAYTTDADSGVLSGIYKVEVLT